MGGVHDAACSQEEQRLEKGMGDQVEDGCTIRADAHAQHHEAQL